MSQEPSTSKEKTSDPRENWSQIEWLASESDKSLQEFLGGLTESQAEALLWDWSLWARPNQLPPASLWSNWLILSGRGWGKTRSGAEWVRSTEARLGGSCRFALVGETAADSRDVMVEGDSGIMGIYPEGEAPKYEPSKRRLTWKSGATASLFNATEPNQLRGPQYTHAWVDEMAKWRYAEETWDMLSFGLRLGDLPQVIITTTPRPIPLLRKLINSPRTVITRGSTYENISNLAPTFIEQVIETYEGTRMGRQELEAEILDDAPGALWTRAMLDDHRVQLNQTEGLPEMVRVVVAIDPAVAEADTMDEGHSETGIIVAALGGDGRAYILDDVSVRDTPGGWARRAVSAFDRHYGDVMVVERNAGGAMVEATLRSVRATLNVKTVWASKGKQIRAEPIAALYEQGRVSHVGTFASLEDQQVAFTADGPLGRGDSDRVDALVWALTELFPQMVRRTDRKTKVRHEGVRGYKVFGRRR